MLYHLRPELRRIRLFLHRERQRGYGTIRSLTLRLPNAVVRKLYAKSARMLNARLLNQRLNTTRFRSFQRRRSPTASPCFYIIVMPGVMHFLLPCLRLLPKNLDVVLLFNGTRAWEREHLRTSFPNLPSFRLWTLPESSIAHGDVITLLLRQHEASFCILDHDIYFFDSSFFERLALDATDYALGVFSGRNAATGIEYPHTHFLFLNAPQLRQIMAHYRADARLYRRLPDRLGPVLAEIGLRPGQYLKEYHNFFDTLHVLFALAHANGLRARILRDTKDIYHVGGTSIGDHRTRDLVEQYIQLRFLEALRDETVEHNSAFLRREFSSSNEIRSRLANTPGFLRIHTAVDELITHLEMSGATSPGGSGRD